MEFVTAALGALFGALAAYFASVALAHAAERRSTTSRLIDDFFSDAFLAHRIAIGQLIRRVEAGEVPIADLAAGFWFPGRGDRYEGTLFNGLNDHQHLEAYIGYLVRLAAAMRAGRLYEDEMRATLGMHLLWQHGLMMRLAEEVRSQVQAAQGELPDWLHAVATASRLVESYGGPVGLGLGPDAT